MDLIEFMHARIDEDEAAAKAASVGGWTGYVDGTVFDAHSGQVAASVASWNLPHVARHDPARVLADVAAKRAIVDQYEEALDRIDKAHALMGATGWPDWGDRAEATFEALNEAAQHLASVYTDHPDFNAAWSDL